MSLLWVLWFWLRRVRLLTSQGNLSRLYGYEYVSRGDINALGRLRVSRLTTRFICIPFRVAWLRLRLQFWLRPFPPSLPFLQCSDVIQTISVDIWFSGYSYLQTLVCVLLSFLAFTNAPVHFVVFTFSSCLHSLCTFLDFI